MESIGCLNKKTILILSNPFLQPNLLQKMKKAIHYITLLCLPSLLLSYTVSAQKKDSPDHTNCYKDVSKDTPELKIDIVDGVSKTEFIKIKVKFTNNTNDYIIYKPKESSFTVAQKDFPISDRMLLISPLSKGSRVLDVKGNGTNVHVDKFMFNINGLGKINANALAVAAPNYKLPVSVNEFTAGNFKVQMLKVDKQTDETKVKFKVTYMGNDYGLVNPNNIAVKTDKTADTEYANAKNNQDAFLLAKGESDTFSASFTIPGKVVDMQFANMEIVWRDTFKDCKLNKLDGQSMVITIDEGKTAGKNK